jgi:hypothetical protein
MGSFVYLDFRRGKGGSIVTIFYVGALGSFLRHLGGAPQSDHLKKRARAESEAAGQQVGTPSVKTA